MTPVVYFNVVTTNFKYNIENNLDFKECELIKKFIKTGYNLDFDYINAFEFANNLKRHNKILVDMAYSIPDVFKDKPYIQTINDEKYLIEVNYFMNYASETIIQYSDLDWISVNS